MSAYGQFYRVSRLAQSNIGNGIAYTSQYLSILLLSTWNGRLESVFARAFLQVRSEGCRQVCCIGERCLVMMEAKLGQDQILRSPIDE